LKFISFKTLDLMAEEYKEPNQNNSGMKESLVQGGDQPPKRAGGLKGAWQWYWEKPLNRWPFLLFLVFAALTVIWAIMYLAGQKTGYIMAGVCAVVMAGYGANHFRLLLGLKEEVDKMAGLNRQFKQENAALRQEVDKLTRARVQLQTVEGELRESNQRLKVNLEKFRELDNNLKNLAGSNLEGLEKLQKSSKAVMDRWKESLIKNEKQILNKVYEAFEYKDDKEDMNEEEFNEFLSNLPTEYRKKFQSIGKTFKELAGDDNLMQYDEFRNLVDVWAEEVGTQGGSGASK